MLLAISPTAGAMAVLIDEWVFNVRMQIIDDEQVKPDTAPSPKIPPTLASVQVLPSFGDLYAKACPFGSFPTRTQSEGKLHDTNTSGLLGAIGIS